MADIPIVGIPSNFRPPGAYAQIEFGQGQSASGSPERAILLAMPMLSTGTWTAAALYGPINDASEVETGAGAGSPAHRAYRIIAKANRDARVFV